jgi:hypothetical protein
MDDQYWIKKTGPAASHAAAAGGQAREDHVHPAEDRLQHRPRAGVDHEVGVFQVMADGQLTGLLPCSWSGRGSVSAGSGVLQGECISGPGVLKRRVSGYLQLQGHKKLHLHTLGNACATREAATVSTPHLGGQERRNRVFPTFSPWVLRRSSASAPDACPPASPARPTAAGQAAGHRVALLFRTRYVISTQPPWMVRDSIKSRLMRRFSGRKKGMPDPNRTG